MKPDVRTHAALLVCIGIICLLPPVAMIFDKPAKLLGIPLPAFYVFSVWIALVVFAALIARWLPKDPE